MDSTVIIIAGHPGRVSSTPSGAILKKTKPRELHFYQNLPTGFQKFCPRLLGFDEDKGEDGGKSVMIELENVVGVCPDACVMDIKVGFIHYEDNATQDKIDYEIFKATNSTTHTLGFRLSGWRVVSHDGEQKTEHKLGKKDAMKTKEEDMEAAFTQFFSGGDRGNSKLNKKALSEAIEELEALIEWFDGNTSHHFRASSMLIVYDGSNAENGGWRRASIHMIDFDHIQILKEPCRDEGVLTGLRSILKIWKALMQIYL